MIKPAKAITPSITKTLNKAKTNMSDNKIVDKKQDTRKRRKNVIISNSSRVIKSHSESIKKAKTNKNQDNNIRSQQNEKDHEELNTEKLLLKEL